MLHEIMDISRLIVHAQEVEESRIRKRNREATKAISIECGSSKNRVGIQYKPKFQKNI